MDPRLFAKANPEDDGVLKFQYIGDRIMGRIKLINGADFTSANLILDL
jgi:hypothetical protein